MTIPNEVSIQRAWPPWLVRPWRRPLFWLAIAVLVFISVSVYAGVSAYSTLYGLDAVDLAIYQQAFASTAQGFRIPFYESVDCIGKARCSALLVHPNFLAYLLVPVYSAFPTPFPLFIVQSIAVGAAAFPLYALTRRVTNSGEKGFIAAGLYLLWAPLMAGEAFSFHWESFLPLEFFSLAASWVTGHRRLAFVAAGFSFVTLEDAPVFSFLLGLFFLVPTIAMWIGDARQRWKEDTVARRTRFIQWFRKVRRDIRTPQTRDAFLLMIVSVVAFLLLYAWLNEWGAGALGISPPSVGPGLSGLLHSTSTGRLNSAATIVSSPVAGELLEFWVLAYALCGFVPLLKPTTLIVAVPWIAFTFLTLAPGFASFGSHASLISAVPVFIGLAYGLASVPLLHGQPSTSSDGGLRSPPSRNRSRRTKMFGSRRSDGRRKLCWAVVLSTVIVLDVLLCSVNPLLADSPLTNLAPIGTHYFHTFGGSTEVADSLRDLARLVPAGALVGAPLPVFLLLANDVRAFCLGCLGHQYKDLPFNLSAGVPYLILDSPALASVGAKLSVLMPNPSSYGVSGYVNVPWPILLYERGYRGPAVLFGPMEPSAQYLLPGSGLVPGQDGFLSANSTSPTGQEIRSISTPTIPGTVWNGSSSYLPPGNHTLSFQLRLSQISPSVTNGSAVLEIQLWSLNGSFLKIPFDAGSLSYGSWDILNVNFTTMSPMLDFQASGVLMNAAFTVAIASLTVDASSA